MTISEVSSTAAMTATLQPTKENSSREQTNEERVAKVKNANSAASDVTNNSSELRGAGGLLHSWLNQSLKAMDALGTAEKQTAKDMVKVATQAARFGSGAEIVASFTSESTELSLTEVEATSTGISEESVSLLLKETRLSLSVTTLGLSSKRAEKILRVL